MTRSKYYVQTCRYLLISHFTCLCLHNLKNIIHNKNKSKNNDCVFVELSLLAIKANTESIKQIFENNLCITKCKNYTVRNSLGLHPDQHQNYHGITSHSCIETQMGPNRYSKPPALFRHQPYSGSQCFHITILVQLLNKLLN